MRAAPVRLDFVQPRLHATAVAIALMLIGVCAVGVVTYSYIVQTRQKSGLELKLAALTRAVPRQPVDRAAAVRLTEEGSRLAQELGAPWTQMLNDLELASADTRGQIAILSVEPDHEKHRIHINAESQDLTLALAFLQRLQKSRSLQYPMLDSHEIVTDNNQHPVRFAMSAEWRESP
jgi:hypothetical protein